MFEQFQQRLEALKVEYASRQQAMADLDAQRAALRDVMLRLSGAIEVIEEELGHVTGNPPQSRPADIPTPLPLPSTYEILDAKDSV